MMTFPDVTMQVIRDDWSSHMANHVDLTIVCNLGTAEGEAIAARVPEDVWAAVAPQLIYSQTTMLARLYDELRPWIGWSSQEHKCARPASEMRWYFDPSRVPEPTPYQCIDWNIECCQIRLWTDDGSGFPAIRLTIPIRTETVWRTRINQRMAEIARTM